MCLPQQVGREIFKYVLIAFIVKTHDVILRRPALNRREVAVLHSVIIKRKELREWALHTD